jgi:hypothetical protein
MRVLFQAPLSLVDGSAQVMNCTYACPLPIDSGLTGKRITIVTFALYELFSLAIAVEKREGQR